MPDNLFQNLSTVQDNLQPNPPTIASAAVITPTHKFTFLTGVVALVTIVPPTTGYCEITLCFTNGGIAAFSVAGNIQIAYQPIINRPIDLCYDPVSAKWWVKAVV
jgi:hypothetical protein